MKNTSNKVNDLKIKLQILLADTEGELTTQNKNQNSLPENTSVLAVIIPNIQAWLAKLETIKDNLRGIRLEDAPSTQDYLKQLNDITLPEIEAVYKAMLDDLRGAKAA